jgi:hypothetical protein
LTNTTVDQSGASSGGDIVGGDKYTTNHTTVVLPSIGGGAVNGNPALERWIAELRAACDADATINHHVRSFEIYARKRTAADGIEGLVNKLSAGNRSHLSDDAIEQKIYFEKLLEEWSLYASAQEIFAHLLAKVQRGFNLTATPNIGILPEPEVDILVDSRVLEPIVQECAIIPQFSVNLNVALGMLYWLADQCFIRWHK